MESGSNFPSATLSTSSLAVMSSLGTGVDGQGVRSARYGRRNTLVRNAVPMQKGSMAGLRESERKPEKSAPHAITMLNSPSRAGWSSGAMVGNTSGVTNQKLMERLMASIIVGSEIPHRSPVAPGPHGASDANTMNMYAANPAHSAGFAIESSGEPFSLSACILSAAGARRAGAYMGRMGERRAMLVCERARGAATPTEKASP
mmetsp:Transcript_63651/g.151764  ORF Transcript_63651/g.151764 Transcript_63651/m.151764 type:complete len:203 (+) Transcript_63651:70-678(+)